MLRSLRIGGFGCYVMGFLGAAAALGCSSGADLEQASAEDVSVTQAALTTPQDPLFSSQWGLYNSGQLVPIPDENGEETLLAGLPGVDINARLAWDITQGSSSVVVGVIETQDVDIGHEDLKDNIFVNSAEIAGDGIDNDANGCVDDVKGCDFIDHDGLTGPYPNEHASNVAGIIAGRINNSKGGVGVAPKVKLLPMRARGNDDTMVQAIQYAKRMGVKIISVSQGGYDWYNQSVYNAIRDSGILFVCSAGNDATARYNYPSSYDLPNIIAVANLRNHGQPSPFSNYGDAHVDIAAPGSGVIGPAPGNLYEHANGTSQAAPHVAGVAALVLNKFPTLSISAIASRILRSGTRLSSLTGVVKSGALVDAYAALTDVSAIVVTAKSEPTKVTLTWPAQSGATRYDVERDGVVVSNGTSTTHVHTSLAAGSTHVYRVRAVVGGTAGLWSHRWLIQAIEEPKSKNRVIESPHPYTPNLADFQVVTEPNATRLRVHFSRLETQPGDFLHYCPNTIECPDSHVLTGSYPTGFWTHWFDGAFRFDFQSNASGQAYGYKIDKIEYVLGIPKTPEPPYLNDDSVPRQLYIGFAATGGASNLNVYRSTSSGSGYVKIKTLSASITEYTDAGLTSGRTYFYKVSASNGLGESPLSGYLQATAQ